MKTSKHRGPSRIDFENPQSSLMSVGRRERETEQKHSLDLSDRPRDKSDTRAGQGACAKQKLPRPKPYLENQVLNLQQAVKRKHERVK